MEDADVLIVQAGVKLSNICEAIALFANYVTRYHDYAPGSHRGASRTNYSPKWPLAIGMRGRC